MASPDNRDHNPSGWRRKPYWHRPWHLIFVGLILLGALLGVAFGGKALGLWEEVGFAVGVVAVAIAVILYSISTAIQRQETGED
ncbi:MAG: hypothetical protein RLN99_15480 [Kiloniellaceae bacterium]